jgi:hypothetical protein
MNISVPRLALIAAVATLAVPAHAMLVLQGPDDFDGTGLGAVNTVLTLLSPGSSSDEIGAVRRLPGEDGDVITGDALTGTSQTQTLSLASLGINSASDLRVVFNAIEPGNADANGITLNDLRLSIFSPDGTELFNSGSLTAPIDFTETFTGVGNAGFVFALDAAQATAAQALAFGADFGDNLVGLYANLSDATGGPETFFVASIPEPQTYALMLAGLGVVGFMAARRRRDVL